MVKLKNIKRINNSISCDYRAEDDADFGYIKVDLNSREFIEHIPCKRISANTYAMHAKRKLIELANENPLPTDSIVMWY